MSYPSPLARLNLKIAFHRILIIQCALLIVTTTIETRNTNILVVAKWTPPGRIQPESVIREIGANVNITCSMNPSHFPHDNSSSLYFEEYETQERIPAEHIRILNATAIVYVLENAKAQNSELVCKSNEDGLGIVRISIGSPPKNVSALNCRGYDYSYLVCNFTKPNNTIGTTYTLSYTSEEVKMRSNNQTEYLQQSRSRLNCTIDKDSCSVCNLTKHAGYFVHTDIFNFELTGRNELGTNTQNFQIRHHEIVRPSRPNFEVNETTSDSVRLKWVMPMEYYHLQKAEKRSIVAAVSLKIESHFWKWKHWTQDIQEEEGLFKLHIGNLPHPYYWYNVRIKVGSKSKGGMPLLSEAYETRFQTRPSKPTEVPLADMGSFDITEPGHSVRLYWQEVPRRHQNGPNFSYVIHHKCSKRNEENDARCLDCETKETFCDFPWRPQHSYEFEIKSRNSHGTTPKATNLIISKYPGDVANFNIRPRWVTSIYHSSNGTFTIEWKTPLHAQNLSNYTVFWCHAKQYNLYECQGSLKWTHVANNVTHYNTPRFDAPMTLAVAANYKGDYSSGMQWTMCTADDSQDLMKLVLKSDKVGTDEISMHWSYDGQCISIVEGYKLTYCRLDESQGDECEPTETVSQTLDKSSKEAILRNLRPYTYYKIIIFAYSKVKEGVKSDPLKLRTHRPTAPLLLYITIAVISVGLLALIYFFISAKLRKIFNIKCQLPNFIVEATRSPSPAEPTQDNEKLHVPEVQYFDTPRISFPCPSDIDNDPPPMLNIKCQRPSEAQDFDSSRISDPCLTDIHNDLTPNADSYNDQAIGTSSYPGTGYVSWNLLQHKSKAPPSSYVFPSQLEPQSVESSDSHSTTILTRNESFKAIVNADNYIRIGK